MTGFIRVHESLEEELKKIQRQMSFKMEKTFGVQIDTSNNVASQVAAKRLKGQKEMNIQIEKIGHNRGRIRIC